MVFYPVKVSQGFFPDLFESSQKLHHITRVGLGECRAHVAASSGLKVLHSSDSVSFFAKRVFWAQSSRHKRETRRLRNRKKKIKIASGTFPRIFFVGETHKTIQKNSKLREITDGSWETAVAVNQIQRSRKKRKFRRKIRLEKKFGPIL